MRIRFCEWQLPYFPGKSIAYRLVVYYTYCSIEKPEVFILMDHMLTTFELHVLACASREISIERNTNNKKKNCDDKDKQKHATVVCIDLKI